MATIGENGKAERVDFIVNLLEKGQCRKDILAKFVKKWQTAERTFDRYLKTANKIQLERQKIASKAASEQYINSRVEAVKNAVMSAQERKEYLTKIIKGEIEIPQTKVFYDSGLGTAVEVPIIEVAGASERIRAISELNKMDGDYAPTKVAETDSKGNDKRVLTDEEFAERLVKAKKILDE